MMGRKTITILLIKKFLIGGDQKLINHFRINIFLVGIKDNREKTELENLISTYSLDI